MRERTTRTCRQPGHSPTRPSRSASRIARPVVPATPAMTEVAALRIQNLRQNLRRFHNARPRPVEVLVPVRHEHAAVLDRGKPRPERVSHQGRHFPAGTLDVESARHDSDHVGVGGGELLDGETAGNAPRPSRGGPCRPPGRRARAPSCPPPSADRSTRCTRWTDGFSRTPPGPEPRRAVPRGGSRAGRRVPGRPAPTPPSGCPSRCRAATSAQGTRCGGLERSWLDAVIIPEVLSAAGASARRRRHPRELEPRAWPAEVVRDVNRPIGSDSFYRGAPTKTARHRPAPVHAARVKTRCPRPVRDPTAPARRRSFRTPHGRRRTVPVPG